MRQRAIGLSNTWLTRVLATVSKVSRGALTSERRAARNGMMWTKHADGTASLPQRTSAAAAWILGTVSLLKHKETSRTVTDSSQRGALRRDAKR